MIINLLPVRHSNNVIVWGTKQFDFWIRSSSVEQECPLFDVFTNFNAQFLYSLTICMLHYNPRHVSSINMPIFRRTNCVITVSGIITLCKWLYSMPDESRLFHFYVGIGRCYLSCPVCFVILDCCVILIQFYFGARILIYLFCLF